MTIFIRRALPCHDFDGHPVWGMAARQISLGFVVDAGSHHVD
jgi:hypothetical protein